MAFQQTYPSFNGWIWGISKFDGAQTDEVLIEAPGVGKAIEFPAWKFSTNTAQALTLETEDDELVDEQYAEQNGGQIARLGFQDPGSGKGGTVKLPENKALTFTSESVGKVSVGILYRVVDA